MSICNVSCRLKLRLHEKGYQVYSVIIKVEVNIYTLGVFV